MTDIVEVDNDKIMAEELAAARKAEATAEQERERRKYVLALESGAGLTLGKRHLEAVAPDKPKLLCERTAGYRLGGWSGIPLGKIALLAGDAGAGKSTLALQLACIVASGAGAKVEWAGHKVMTAGRVLYLGAEDDETMIARRIRHVMGGLNFTPEQIANTEANFLLPPGRLPAGSSLIETQRMSLAAVGGEEHLGRPVNSLSATYTKPGDVLEAIGSLVQTELAKGLKLIVIDPLNAFSAADVETDPDVAGALMRYAGDLAEHTGATVLFTHHTRKPPQAHGGLTAYAPGADSIRGTSALKAQVRWAGVVYRGRHKASDPSDSDFWTLEQHDSAAGIVTFRTVKANDGLDWTPPHTMKRNDYGVLLDDTAAATVTAEEKSDSAKKRRSFIDGGAF